MTEATTYAEDSARPSWQPEGSRRATPFIVLAPSLLASFIYVFVFTLWTFYISLSDSTLLPTYNFVGFQHYISIWANQRWQIAYSNLFLFSGLYVVISILIGLGLAIAIDQRVRGEAIWRTIFLYPLAVSFAVTGTVWSWLYSPNAGIEFFVRSLGWTDFTFRLTTDRNLAIYAVIATGIWQSSGFAMALFLAGLRSVDGDLVKAAQIDRAGNLSHLSSGDHPHHRPDRHRGRGGAAAVRDQDLRSRRGADQRRRPRNFDDISGDLCL